MLQSARRTSSKLTGEACKVLAVQAIAGSETIRALAERNGVSRPTVYRQMNHADAALNARFLGRPPADNEILFMLPVTTLWLRQVMLALTLVGHASFRGVIEFMRDLLGVSVSLGTVHNVHQQAARRARSISAGIDLSPVRVGLHDELFQGSQPVLAGIDVRSTDCYLLAPKAQRDGETWAIHLLDLRTQGLRPDYTIADAGRALRAGQQLAWPDTPCHGDVFHIIRQGRDLASLMMRIADGMRTRRVALETRLANPRRRCDDHLLEATLEALRRDEAQAHARATDLRTLVQWLECDILSLAGPTRPARETLFDFVVDELRQREVQDPAHIGPFLRALQNQRDDLLAFAGVLDERLDTIARTHDIAPELVRAVCVLHRKPQTSSAFWQDWNRLAARVGRQFHGVCAAVTDAMERTPRSSSMVENLNSRIRVCLTNRRHLDGGRSWLDLLRFAINHRPFARSRCAQRLGRTPRQLMSGQPHEHWLTLLGLGSLQPLQD